jgi:hypothetical protein
MSVAPALAPACSEVFLHESLQDDFVERSAVKIKGSLSDQAAL